MWKKEYRLKINEGRNSLFANLFSLLFNLHHTFVLRTRAVGEHFGCREGLPARGTGAAGRENVGMSNHNPNEKLEPRKSKVSVALAINHGLGGPKAMVKTASDGQLVNIPALPYDYPLRANEISRRALLVWHSLYRVQAGTERR